MGTITCPTPITTLTANVGWWIDNILSPCGGTDLGTSTGGAPAILNCPGGIKGVNHVEGTKTGSIQLICKDGTTTQTAGDAAGDGAGPLVNFMCPTDQLLNTINGTNVTGAISGLSFGCMGSNTTTPIVTTPITAPAPLTMPTPTTTNTNTMTTSTSKVWIWIVVGIIFLLIIGGVIFFLKKRGTI